MPRNDDFIRNPDEKFRVKMQPAAKQIYGELFPGCELEDLRKDGFKVHVLDQQFSIDSLLKFQSQQWITLQEKYRRSNNWSFHDFTQEYMNGKGAEIEQGEWFHLAAQVYFYGWANESETQSDHWLLLDVAAYKLLVEEAGGIEKIGILQQNKSMYEGGHGQATFYGIYLKFLKPAILVSYEIFDKQGDVVCFMNLRGHECEKCKKYERHLRR